MGMAYVLELAVYQVLGSMSQRHAGIWTVMYGVAWNSAIWSMLETTQWLWHPS